MIYHHLIDGRAVPGRLTFPTYAPGTGEVLAELARGDAADVDAAVASARRAWPAWAALDPYEKERILRRVGDVVMEHLDELAALEATDVGKPVAAARLIDVPRTADTFWYFSGWPTKLTGETLPVRGAVFTYTRREPIGVVAAIVPWNFPLLLAARKIAAALCAGNTVVVKPPEQASLSILRLGELLLEAGLPPGCCNVVTGLGPEAGAALVEHPGVGKITFTGGTVTGRAIMASASRTLKRVSLELGGKSPNIVFADADLDAAAKAAGPAVFYNQGEICTAGSRLLVERPAYERMVDAVAAAARALTPGDPLDPKTTLGPTHHVAAPRPGARLHRLGPRRGRPRGGGRRARPQRLLRGAHRVRRRHARDDHRPRGDLRPGPVGPPVRRRWRRPPPWPTPRSSASRPGSGPATSARRTRSRRGCRRARCGSTPTTASTRWRRTAATSSRASGARTGGRCSTR
jgi:acyl-CoA reductase-like NAD-dependent aldehyde dehydrogenase